MTLDRAPEVGGKAGEECLRSLGSPEGCGESLEVPRRHHVEVDLVVAPKGRMKFVALLRVLRYPADYVIGICQQGRDGPTSPFR